MEEGGESAITDEMCFCVLQANVQLVEMLVEEGGESVITDETNKDGQNILHLMAKQCSSHDFASLIKIISKVHCI